MGHHIHSIAEIQRRFEEESITDVQTTTLIKYSDQLDVFRFGECGGLLA